MKRAVVLVTDGDQRAALAVTRSLGAAGHHVIVGAPARGAIAASSRHAAGFAPLPPADAGSAGWREAALAAIDRHSVDLVVPITESSTLAALHGELTERTRVAGPSLEAFEAIRDKQALLERAVRLGIEVPRQFTVTSPDSLRGEIDVTFPLVIKPARSVFADGAGLARLGVSYAHGPDELAAGLRAIPAAAYPVLVQEHIRGPGVGVFGLLWDGERRATFTHRRIREKPPTGGVSVCSESVRLPERIVEASFRLLASYGWQGVAMVEYKLEASTGRAVLMEVNGRFWGSLQLAIHAGVDFPRLFAAAALGAYERGPAEWRLGVRNHWEWGEVDAALIRWRRPVPPQLAPGTFRLDELGIVTGDRRRHRPEVFRLTDPLPFVRETLAWLRRR